MTARTPQPVGPFRANRAAALRLLRRHRRLSRAEIAQRSGLSEASVSRIVAELARRGLLVEEGVARSTGGRPAVRLRLDDQLYRSFGVDIHSWETRICWASLGGSTQDTAFIRTHSDPYKTLDAIAAHIEEAKNEQGDRVIEGVGVAIRGLVSSRAGIVECGADPGWVRIPVRQHLQNRLQLPVFIENNVRAAAFAEYHYGSPGLHEPHCLLFVKIDEGVGISMMFDGQLYYGQHMAAGEYGQMVIADAGGSKGHNRPGCLEELAADGALYRRYAARKGGSRNGTPGDVNARARHVCHLAMSGDKTALAALRETVRYLGIGISNVVWGLDPDVVILDGAITEAWPLAVPVITEQFADGREFLNFKNLVLQPSALQGGAVIAGAAALPFQPLFNRAEHARMID